MQAHDVARSKPNKSAGAKGACTKVGRRNRRGCLPLHKLKRRRGYGEHALGVNVTTAASELATMESKQCMGCGEACTIGTGIMQTTWGLSAAEQSAGAMG